MTSSFIPFRLSPHCPHKPPKRLLYRLNEFKVGILISLLLLFIAVLFPFIREGIPVLPESFPALLPLFPG